MKREEREYAEVVPEATRKARLEQEAATLMSLPKDIRTMLMMKLKPIDMYALYRGVDNVEFQRWCDTEFWYHAIRRDYNGHLKQMMADNPFFGEFGQNLKWLFFSHALPHEITLRKYGQSETFEFAGANLENARLRLDFASPDEAPRMWQVQLNFDETLVDFAARLYRLMVHDAQRVLTVSRGWQGTIIFSTETNFIVPNILYMLFEAGYYLIIRHKNKPVFLLGCHLCCSPDHPQDRFGIASQHPG